VVEVLEEVIKRIPPPKGDPSKPLTALIFDSWFDSYQGAMVLVRVFDGVIEKGKRIRMMSSGKDFEVQEIGIFNPNRAVVERLGPGEVG
jgi:GTP-binding protein LepA